MFINAPAPVKNEPATVPAPNQGLNAITPLMSMRPTNAVALENWIPVPGGLESRDGYIDHVTAFTHNVDRLHVYNSSVGAESLWATTVSGVYAATTAGTMPAASIALTYGFTVSTAISTGAGNYLLMVNGVDTLKQYDGTAWTSIALFGATATSIYDYIETYRQRIFLAKKNSLEIEYLAANSVAGAATNYPLGAIFRQGGYIIALGTWTIDGGIGPEDNLAVLTNKGEVAVFAGSDPATWSLKGVYYIGQPIGRTPFFKYGGDILIITATGIFPLSQVVQTASIDRTRRVSQDIQPLLAAAATSFGTVAGWQLVAQPNFPFILLNIPSTPLARQAVMHGQTQAWTFFSGWQATCFALMNKELYYGTANSVCRVTGVSDNGTNITCTMLQAPQRFGYQRNKLLELVKPYFSTTGQFNYSLGIAPNFLDPKEITNINLASGLPTSLWGSGVWGTAIWTGAVSEIQDWQTVPDEYSLWKSLYVQVVSNSAKITYIGADVRLTLGGDF